MEHVGQDKKSAEVYPMRINKYLALKGHSTRRGADELITQHKIYINGREAELGDKVLSDDIVEVRGSGKPKNTVYFAYNKPKGDVTEQANANGVFPVGRLDKDSHGLIILTNDGRITDRLLNPDREHEKEYKVTTQDKLREGFAARMAAGIDLGDFVTKPCSVTRTGDFSFRIILKEGKKHQIRRMADAMKNGVKELERVRVMNIKLDGLKPGALRKIEGDELAVFLTSLGL